MKRTLTSLFALVICGLALAAHDEPEQGEPKVTTLSEKDIALETRWQEGQGDDGGGHA